jgi:hypothetical protein
VLQFLQQLCETHFPSMQRLLCVQPNNKLSFNLTLRLVSLFDRCGLLLTMDAPCASAAASALACLVELCQVRARMCVCGCVCVCVCVGVCVCGWVLRLYACVIHDSLPAFMTC